MKKEFAKTDIYEEVTNKIITMLEAGEIPWKKAWSGGASKFAYNRVSKKCYSLLNQLLLADQVETEDGKTRISFKGGEWATFKQWSDLGGKIKKGEHGKGIVFWKMLEVKEETEDGEEIKRKIPILKKYTVFHISQVEGVEALDPFKPNEDFNPIEEAEKLLEDYTSREGIMLNIIESARAFYRPSDDSITLPLREQFISEAEFYGTAFHEATHSTLKESRCNRRVDAEKVAFGSEDYSKEELVAEMGSAFILGRLGIATEDTEKNNAAYIQSWIKALKNDNRLIVGASAQAEKAVKFIFGEKID